MPSPRSRFETACRIGAFGALGWLLGNSIIPSVPRGIDRAAGASLPSRLSGWTRTSPNIALHAELDAAPGASTIDWLSALAHAGHSVTWSGTPPAVAMTAEPLTDPNGGVRIDIAAPRAQGVLIRDDLGIIDSLRVAVAGGSATAPVIVGRVRALAGVQQFGVAAPDSARVRSIVVVGSAGWEGKFIVSALEERGWPVVARFLIAPKVDVADGGAIALDTGRVAAVIAIDTSLQSLGGAIERYVRSGGGLILAGPSGLSSSVASFAPGTLGARVRGRQESTDTVTLGSSGFYPVSSVRADAIVLDRRPAGVAIAARRVGAGRVIQVGYDDSWRWRMAGPIGSERAHRDWWARVVGSVAYVPATRAAAVLGDAAPLVSLVDRLGPARQITGDGARRAQVDPRWLLAVMLILLLAEWSSRRWRGLK